MENQPQNPEFRYNPENFHPCFSVFADIGISSYWTWPSVQYLFHVVAFMLFKGGFPYMHTISI